MNRRTKILAIGFGAVVAYVAISQLVYPNWIKPLFTLDQQIAEKNGELEKLEKLQKAFDDARVEYRDYVARIGSFDPGQVETAIRDRLNALIEKYKLENAGVAPSRPVEDRKTGLITSTITITGTGPLESAIGFMKEIAELPQLVRLGNPAISPSGSGKKAEEQDLVNVRLPIEVLVLPRNKTVGAIDPATLPKSEAFVRHDSTRDYADIWNRKPFIPYVVYPPLKVDVQKIVNVEVGKPATIQATASGGNGEYKFSWAPSDGLTEPNQAKTVVDSSAPRTQTYTVTVTDTIKDHQPVTATVAVTIREPQPVAKVEPAPPPPPPPPPQPVQAATWPDAKFMQIVMTLMRSSGTNRTNELMVYNTRTKDTTYHKVTEEFDGGRLLFVHQTGAVVGRNKKYYVYPLGTTLGDCMEYQTAADYPELKAAAERAIAMETAQAEAKKKVPPVAAPPPAKQPVVPQPVEDSHGGENTAPAGASGPVENVADGSGPVVPAVNADSGVTELMGPPSPSPQPAPPTTQQDMQSQPAPKPQEPTGTPPTPGSRPRQPKGKKPGRV